MASRGHRVTPQRLAILEVLAKSEGHPAANQVQRRVQRRFPMVGKATVYNTMQLLKDLGQVLVRTDPEATADEPDSHQHPPGVGSGAGHCRGSRMGGGLRPTGHHLDPVAPEHPQRGHRVQAPRGGRAPARCEVRHPHVRVEPSCALGKAIAAHLEEETRRQLLDTDLARLTGRTITDHLVLERELEQVARRGVAVEDQEAIVGEAGVAAPVFNHIGAPVGAIGVAGPVERLLERGLAPDVVAAVRETARSLSREMGAGRVSARAR